MSISFVATIFKDINEAGASRLFGLPMESRYSPIHESLLSDSNFDKITSSTLVSPPIAGFSNIVFFDKGDLSGSFCQVSAAPSVSRTANLTDFNFNDKTRSILCMLAAEIPELRLSFRDEFLDAWDSMLDADLGSDAMRTGDPILTWEIFPENVSHLDPTLTYLKIQQPLRINVPDWFDYDAWIKYHVFLFLDGSNLLNGFCQRWEYWVESGVKESRIAHRLEPKVIAGAQTLTSTIKSLIGGQGPFKSLYYVPGRQLSSFSGVVTGSTTDDVTIVLGH